MNLPDEMLHAIHAHPGHIPCATKLDWALFCSDPVTGLIVAGVLMHPSKKLAHIDTGYMIRRFKEKTFRGRSQPRQYFQMRKTGVVIGKLYDTCY